MRISERPCLFDAPWSQQILFSWVFPIVKLATSKRLNLEQLGGLRQQDLIETKLEKVEMIYDGQPKDN